MIKTQLLILLVTLTIAPLCLAQSTATARLTTGVLAISQKAENRLPPIPSETENITSYTFQNTVKITHQRDLRESTAPITILFALPNGNTTEQTFGRTKSDEIDWHYAIQHIGAQTRRLREVLNRPVSAIYLEADTLSWPAWRKADSDATNTIVRLFTELEQKYALPNDTVILAAHSGGGSLIFGLIEAGRLPVWIDQILLLDASYNYQGNLHAAPIMEWLATSADHRYTSFAYDERRVMLNGKLLVSPTGGTWRANERMLSSIDGWTSQTISGGPAGIDHWTRPNAHVLNVHNPGNAILHTVIVEKNGLVWGLLNALNLPAEEVDEFFDKTEEGYRKWIR